MIWDLSSREPVLRLDTACRGKAQPGYSPACKLEGKGRSCNLCDEVKASRRRRQSSVPPKFIRFRVNKRLSSSCKKNTLKRTYKAQRHRGLRRYVRQKPESFCGVTEVKPRESSGGLAFIRTKEEDAPWARLQKAQ